MELTGQSKSDPALPSSFITDAINMSFDRPTMWYVWSYDNNSRGQPVNLAEKFFELIENTKIVVNGNMEVTILDLVETLLAHPEEVNIHVK